MRVPPIGFCPRPGLCVFPGQYSATCRGNEERLAAGPLGMPVRSSDSEESSSNVL
jgi:hypothetical protein